MYSTSVLLDKIHWDVAVHFHNIKYILMPVVPSVSGVRFNFFQLPMVQHCHNIVSRPGFHFLLLLVRPDHSQTTP